MSRRTGLAAMVVILTGESKKGTAMADRMDYPVDGHRQNACATAKTRPMMQTFGLCISAVALLAFARPAEAETITVWSGFPEMVPFYEHVAEGMRDEFPDLEVVVEAVPLREHERRIALSVAAGTAADVIELAYSTAQRYLEAGALQPAPDTVSGFVGDTAHFSAFFQEAATHDGQIYGAPLFRGQGALFYNTDMLAAAGLEGPPTTMADYTAYAEALTQRGDNGDPTVSGWSLRLSGGGQGIAEKFWINLFQFGGSVLMQTEDGGWVSDYANEAGRQALGQYLDNLYGLNTVSIEMPADAEAFQRGQTAMFIRESWVIGDTASKAPDLNYATAPLPVGSIVLPVNLYVTSDGSAGDMAWEFALAANEAANQVWLLDNVGWLPNRQDVDYSAVIEAKPAFDAFVNYPADYQFFSLPAIGPIEEILTRLAERLVTAFGDAELAGDEAAIDAVLAEAAAETDRILEREGLLGSR